MLTTTELKALVGHRIILDLTSAADSPVVRSKLLGTVDALDGLVLIIEPDDRPGTRQSVHSHHVASARAV